MYRRLESNLVGSDNKLISKSKIPLKIKIFLWKLFYDAILTRSNMRKRKWIGCPKCSFCGNIETAMHLFFTCNTARVVWGVLGACVGTNTCPRNIWQSFVWFRKFIPNKGEFYTLLLAALCWAIWTIRNKVTLCLHYGLFCDILGRSI